MKFFDIFVRKRQDENTPDFLDVAGFDERMKGYLLSLNFQKIKIAVILSFIVIFALVFVCLRSLFLHKNDIVQVFLKKNLDDLEFLFYDSSQFLLSGFSFWVLAIGFMIVAYLIVQKFPKAKQAYFAYEILQARKQCRKPDPSRGYLKSLKKSVDEVQNKRGYKDVNPEQALLFLYEHRRAKYVPVLFFLFLVLICFAYVFDTNNYKILTRTGLLYNPYFGFSERFIPYEDAMDIQAGCKKVRRNKKTRIEARYEFRFPEGVSVNLMKSFSFGRDFVSNLENFDRFIQQWDIPVIPVMIDDTSGSSDPKQLCRQHLQRMFGEDARRMETIFRLNQ